MAEVMQGLPEQRNKGGCQTKYKESWFSVNRRIYVHNRTLLELREIEAQQSLSSDYKVVKYVLSNAPSTTY